MRKYIFLLIFALVSLAPIQSSASLDISNGDIFHFTLTSFDSEIGSSLTILPVVPDGYAANGSAISLQEGDQFSVRILDTSTYPNENPYQNNYVMVEYTHGSSFMVTEQFVWLGALITETNWDTYREELDVTPEDFLVGEEVEVIETDEEFGYVRTYTDEVNVYVADPLAWFSFKGIEIRYEKSTGVVSYMRAYSTYIDGQENDDIEQNYELELRRSMDENSNGDLSLPGFEFYSILGTIIIGLYKRKIK